MFVCIASSSQTLHLNWFINGDPVFSFPPSDDVVKDRDIQNSTLAVYVPSDDGVISYLHLIKLPEVDNIKVICNYDEDAVKSVTVQGIRFSLFSIPLMYCSSFCIFYIHFVKENFHCQNLQ